MVYPLFFHEVYKSYLWGGRRLAEMGKVLPPDGVVAESWEISGHPNGPSIVRNGPLSGMPLPDVLALWGARLVGTFASPSDLRRFPLLVKLIDARDRLSVQVHPDDDYARIHAGETGKSEMWYVVAADPGASLVLGVRPGVGRDAFRQALAAGTCEDLLQVVPVSAGDAVNIPARLVHAIGRGLVICEIQQSSDTTYRVFDYNRTDAAGRLRPLHVEAALDVIDFNNCSGVSRLAGLALPMGLPDVAAGPASGVAGRLLVLNRYFRVEEMTLDEGGTWTWTGDGSRPLLATVLAGTGTLQAAQDGIVHPLSAGGSFLLPADLGPCRIGGRLRILAATLSRQREELAALSDETGLSPDEIAARIATTPRHD